MIFHEKRLLRKLYPASTNFLSLIPESINSGFIAENYVAMILKNSHKNVFLYNRRQKEIDFLIPDKKIAVEVKYQEKIHPSDYKLLAQFVREKRYKKGIIVTKNGRDSIKDNTIESISIEDIEDIKW